MLRTSIGAVALSLAIGGVLAPSAARAATPDPAATATATVTASSSVHDEMATYVRTVTGFAPNATVTVAVAVNGKPYAGSFTATRKTDAAGAISGWNWIWTAGDPYGTYTFTFTDAAQHTASATIDINHTPTSPSPAAGTGLMVDTASTPAAATVEAWKSGGAPYSAIGVYIRPEADVDNRHDKDQTQLTSDWVSEVQGGDHPWHVIPIHVGLQAPESCQRDGNAFHEMDADPAKARVEGTDAADSAAAQSTALGIARTSPVVADIESYGTGTDCSAAVQAYLGGWSAELHRRGWLAGVYGAPSGVAQDLAAAKSASAAYVLPDVIWAATDNRHASTDVAGVATEPWTVANQFLLGVNRTYGNTTLPVDESSFDWSIWDETAPVVTGNGAPSLVRAPAATFTWSGVDAESAVARYEVRTRRTAGGHRPGAWSPVSTTAPTVPGRMSLSLRPGEQVCVQVRGFDEAGNRSGWTPAACSSRLADDRSVNAGPGWKRAHQRSAYGRTVTTTARRRAVLTLGNATAGARLAVVRSGRGPLVVAVGGRRVATITGNGTSSVRLPRSGKVTLTTSTTKRVVVDAYAFVPRP